MCEKSVQVVDSSGRLGVDSTGEVEDKVGEPAGLEGALPAGVDSVEALLLLGVVEADELGVLVLATEELMGVTDDDSGPTGVGPDGEMTGVDEGVSVGEVADSVVLPEG